MNNERGTNFERGINERQANGTMAGFLVGAVVGAGVALLMAPASGSDTRRRIKEKAEEFRGRAAEFKDGARAKLEEVGQSVRGAARDLTGAVKEGRDAFQKATDDPSMRSKGI